MLAIHPGIDHGNLDIASGDDSLRRFDMHVADAGLQFKIRVTIGFPHHMKRFHRLHGFYPLVLFQQFQCLFHGLISGYFVNDTMYAQGIDGPLRHLT